MDTTRTCRPRLSHRGRAMLAFAALTAMVLGCDPVLRPGDDHGESNNQQDSGDMFDTGSSGNGGSPSQDCGGGPYLFSVSASDVDPWEQTGEVGQQGVTTLWLWKADGGGLAAVAADFEIQAATDPGTFVAFNAVAPNLNITQEGLQQVFLAVAGCPTGPVLLGQVTVYGRPETLRIRLAALGGTSVAVDCCGTQPGYPIACDWFTGTLADTTASDTTRAAAGT